MRTFLTKFCSTILGVMLSATAFGQLTGIKNIPGDYADLATAITTLNSQGVGAGGVTINLLAGNPQTAPAGGYVITATGISANPITFQGNANIITASAAQTVGSVTDALIKIGGGDYITIDNFQLRDNAANTVFASAATNTMTEFGIVLARATTADGAKNNTISNCNIQLRQGGAYTTTIGIYASARHDYNAVYTTAVANAVGGENSNNVYRNNTISGVTSGIVIVGDGTNVDLNNTVGGTSGQGNNITLAATTASMLTTYAGYIASRMDGIFLLSPQACNVNYNTVGMVAGSSLAVAGIYLSSAAGSTAYTNNTNNNNVTVTNTGANTYYGIWNTAGNAAATQNTNNNTISINTLGTTYGVYLGLANSVNNVNTNNITVVNTGTGTVAAVYNSIANSSLNVTNNTFNVSVTGTTSGTNYFFYNSSTHPTAFNVTGNTFASTSGLNSTGTTYMIYQSSGTPNGNISNNVTSGTITKTSASGTFYMYYNFGSPTPVGGMEVNNNNNFSNITCSGTTIFYGWRNSTLSTHNKTINGNVFNNIFMGSGTSAILTTDYMTTASVANNNKIDNVTATGTIYGFNFGYGSTLGGVGFGIGGYFTGNKITNISSSGASAVVTPIFISPVAANSMVLNNDTVINASASGTTSPIVRGIHIYGGTNDTVANCYVSGITTTAGVGSAVVNGITVAGGTCTTPFAYNNNVNNISSGTSAGASTQSIGISVIGGTTAVNVYNNFISNITAPSASNANAIVGINIGNSGTINNRIFFNTIKIGVAGTPVTSTGTDFGVAGLLYPNTATVTNNVKNNIININGTPSGTGMVAAVRRNSIGTANTVPANFSGGSNVYYTNTGANNYLVVEGTLNTNAVNGYAVSGVTASVPNNIVNDANFNTPCGVYKSFMAGAENSTTTENNMVAGTITGTFTPSGASFAESGGVAIATPSITFDQVNAVRSATPDIGAKEFTGTATDVAAPTIAYTPLTNTFCTAAISLTATINDGTGVNLTAGTRPRIYYKKSTEANAFGTYPANNVSTFNGWKYVESTNTGTTHTFAFNYSLLTSAVTNGDVIQYFVAAQDVNTTPNAGFSTVALATGYCATGVNLPPAAGPVQASPVVNSFSISTIPSFTATATLTDLCQSGSTSVTLTPVVLNGSTIQWQFDNYNNIYSDIPSANAATYTTPVIIDTAKYRANIYCGTTIIATSSVATVNVNNPVVTTVTGDTICPNQAATLSATSTSGSNFSWYANSTGGTALATGTSFTTPSIPSTTTYYVSASTGSTTNVGLPSNAATYGTYGSSTLTDWPLRFNTTAAGTITQLTVYPTTVGPLNIALRAALSSTDIFVAGPFNFTASQLNTPVVLTVNIPVPTTGSYQLTNSVGGVGRMSPYNGTGGGYPFNAPGISIVASSALSTSANVTTYYNSFYNLVWQTGCEGNRFPVVATVAPQPTATFSSTASSICQGAAGSVNVNFTGYGPWSFSYTDGTTPGTVNNITTNPYSLAVTPPAPNSTYTLTAISDSRCANSPLAPSSAMVNTYPQPTATLGGTQAVCDGTQAFLPLNFTGTGPWTYTFSDGTTQTTATTPASSSNLSVTPTTNTTYSVVSMNDANCTATPSNITNNAVVTLNPRPTVALAVTDTTCANSNATLTLNFTGTGPWIYDYTDGTTAVSGSTSSNPYMVTVNPATTTTYSFNYLQDANCFSQPADISGTATVTVVPGASITTQPTNASACSNSDVSFTVGANGWGVMYQWYDGNNVALVDGPIFSGTQTNTLSISNITGLNGTNYYAVATGNCTPPATSNTVTVTEGFSSAWNGAVDALWSNPSNWSCGSVPNEYIDVIIPVFAPNQPVVDILGAECHDFTLLGAANLSFNTNMQLSIYGDVMNTTGGNINGTGGKVILTGTTQNVVGSITVDNLDVAGGGVKTFSSDVTVNGILNLMSGNIELDSANLTMTQPTAQLGGSALSFIVTNGTGKVIANNMGAIGGNPDAVMFHVGINGGSYTPMSLENLGDADNYSVRVMANVYEDGTGVIPTTVTNPVVDRTWLVEEMTAGGSIVNMEPYWNTPTDEINGFDPTHVFVAHYTGGEWISYVDSASGAPAATPAGPGMFKTTLDSLTSFSPFTVASSGQFPLAIRLSSITATNVGTRNKVQWKSETEDAGDSYELESSADGKKFTKIATVAGNGNASTYTQWDEQPVQGVNYYRVKLLNIDGSSSYSKVVTATVRGTDGFSIEAYPNPVKNTVSVKVDGVVTGKATVVITDVTGKVVKAATQVLNNGAEINVTDLANGIYLLNYTDDVRSESIKINKQ